MNKKLTMGQGQSQSDKSVSTNYAPKHSTSSAKGKKSKRRSSTKSDPQSSWTSSSVHAAQSSERKQQSNPSLRTSGSTTSPSTSGKTSAITSTSTASQLAGVSTGVPPHRGSFSTGGERSVPSRQFSLTRSQSSSQPIQNRHAQIEKYFNKYRDNGEDAILAEGMEKFCVDLGVDPTEFIVLVLAWKFEASQMCRFTREEFINGCQKMEAHNAKSLKERFPELLAEAKEKKNFKNLYNFTFSFGLDHSSGQRSLPIDMAVPLWNLVFTQNKPDILDRWFEFLKEIEVRGVSRDTWNMFLPFVEATLPDLSNYDESEAWPSLFDDFVEAEQEKTTL